MYRENDLAPTVTVLCIRNFTWMIVRAKPFYVHENQCTQILNLSSPVINNIIYKFFKDFINYKKKTNRAVVFSSGRFPNILKYSDHQCDLPTIWKTKLFKHILKSSVSMYESSGSQFIRTTTATQLGLDVFDESRFIMTFLTILGVTYILYSFRLVPVPYPELFGSQYTGLGSWNQTPKLSKVLLSGVSIRYRSLSPSHKSDVLSLFRMQNSQNFLELCTWTPLGRAYSAPQTTQMHNGFSPCYTCQKTSTPPKLLDMTLSSRRENR